MTGLEIDRLEASQKVTGVARYAADYKFEGMLYAFALKTSVASGTIAVIDTRLAE